MCVHIPIVFTDYRSYYIALDYLLDFYYKSQKLFHHYIAYTDYNKSAAFYVISIKCFS